MKFDTYPEIHCDECFEVNHNHFVKCPACGIEGAGTTGYCALYELLIGDTLGCELCGATWRLVDKKAGWDPDEYEWERIRNGKSEDKKSPEG